MATKAFLTALRKKYKLGEYSRKAQTRSTKRRKTKLKVKTAIPKLELFDAVTRTAAPPMRREPLKQIIRFTDDPGKGDLLAPVRPTDRFGGVMIRDQAVT